MLGRLGKPNREAVVVTEAGGPMEPVSIQRRPMDGYMGNVGIARMAEIEQLAGTLRGPRELLVNATPVGGDPFRYFSTDTPCLHEASQLVRDRRCIQQLSGKSKTRGSRGDIEHRQPPAIGMHPKGRASRTLSTPFRLRAMKVMHRDRVTRCVAQANGVRTTLFPALVRL